MRTTSSFDRFAGLAAILAALTGLLYSIAFVVLQNVLLSSLFLMLGGLLSLVALVALFERLGEVDTQVAMLGLMLGAIAALGATIHGGYDLANAINPPGALPEGVANLPSPIDPRGLLTFGVAGLSVLVAGSLMRHPSLFRWLYSPDLCAWNLVDRRLLGPLDRIDALQPAGFVARRRHRLHHQSAVVSPAWTEPAA